MNLSVRDSPRLSQCSYYYYNYNDVHVHSMGRHIKARALGAQRRRREPRRWRWSRRRWWWGSRTSLCRARRPRGRIWGGPSTGWESSARRWRCLAVWESPSPGTAAWWSGPLSIRLKKMPTCHKTKTNSMVNVGKALEPSQLGYQYAWGKYSSSPSNLRPLQISADTGLKKSAVPKHGFIYVEIGREEFQVFKERTASYRGFHRTEMSPDTVEQNGRDGPAEGPWL